MTPKLALNFSDGRTCFIEARPQETVVDAALRHGVVLPVDCREGVCGTCRGVCVKGDYQLRYAHQDALSEDEAAEGIVLCCQTVVRSDCIINFDFDSTVAVRRSPDVYHARLCAIHRISDAVSILELTLNAGERFDYLPGQYAHLRVPGTESRRSFSFASAPGGDGHLRFIVRTLPRGDMSEYVRQRARVGDAIDLEGPFGSFYMREMRRPAMFLAGGTGISAFLGMLEVLDLTSAPDFPVTLLYGVTNEEDLCELQRLEAYRSTIPQFSFQATVINGTSEWTGRRGLVTDLLEDGILHKDGMDVYVCGPPPMVTAVRLYFRNLGLENIQLYVEKFSKS